MPPVTPLHTATNCSYPRCAEIYENPQRLTWVEGRELAALIEHAPGNVEHIALVLLADAVTGYGHAVDWLWKVAKSLPVVDLLPVPMAVVVGMTTAKDTLVELGLDRLATSPYDDKPDAEIIRRLEPHPLTKLWNDIILLSKVQRRGPEITGILHRVETCATKYPRHWAESLPLLTAVGSSIDDIDVDLTVTLSPKHPEVSAALSQCAVSPYAKVRLRAQGIQVMSNGSMDLSQGMLVDALARATDRKRDEFPQPLAAPSATWLATHSLESLVRGAVREALDEFVDVVNAQGAAEEEGLTESLLTLLQKQFEAARQLLQLSGNRQGLNEINLRRRTVPKAEEHTVGADIGMICTVRIDNSLVVRFGDLVQVKKSRKIAEGGHGERWRIEIQQLNDLLKHSATAVYWLICSDGKVIVVPAKIILALRQGASQARKGSFTVPYQQVRHSCIGLGQYLCDLLVGMWLGSSNPETLQVADGTGARTRPRTMLEIRVTRSDG